MYANTVIVVSYALVPVPVALMTRTAIAVAFFAIPNVLDIASPINTAVCMHAAIYKTPGVLPATLVPCPLGSDIGELFGSTKSVPFYSNVWHTTPFAGTDAIFISLIYSPKMLCFQIPRCQC